MKIAACLALSLVAALSVGGGFMMIDPSRGAEWVVSPSQIAQAHAEGKAGVGNDTGSVTVLPIRSETADVLPVKWALAGIGAGALCLAATRRRSNGREKRP